jgi:integrase/recombinase XerD
MSPDYISEFISYLGAERGLSPHTLMAYERDLNSLQKHAGNSWPPTLDTIMQFLRSQQLDGKKSSSIVRALVAIKVFMRYLFREKYITEDVSTFLDAPRVQQLIPSILSHQELEELLQAPDLSTEEGICDRAIFELLYGTGIRISELCGLTIYDVSDEYIKVCGKGSKERLVPIPKSVLEFVDKYLVEVRERYDSKDLRALFLNSKGKPIDRTLIWKRIQEYAKRLGIEKRISPHTFRHTYASHLLDAGADVRIIQELLGHAHISSTNRYTHVSTDQLRETFRAFHPRW